MNWKDIHPSNLYLDIPENSEDTYSILPIRESKTYPPKTDQIIWEVAGYLGDWKPFNSLCKKFKRDKMCEEEHTPRAIRYSCKKPYCLLCYEDWMAEQSACASERIKACKEEYRKRKKNFGECKHVVLSPPQAEAIELIKTKEGFKKLRQKAIKLAKKAGMVGFVLIFHPYRWKNGIKTPENQYLSPHFHIIGFGYLQNSDQFYNLWPLFYELD